MNHIDGYMSCLNDRVMSGAQHAIDELNYALDEMQMAADENPEREDIKACVAEVKEKSKKALAECWAAANHWSEHFDGLCNGDKTENDDPTEKEKKPVKKTDGE